MIKKSSLWKLGLTFPGSVGDITISPGNTPTNNNFPAETFTVATAISSFSVVALYVGGALMFFWAIWGVFDYIKAEGNKEALAKARKKIQWAIVGFVILILAFFVSDTLSKILIPGGIIRPIEPLTK